MISLVAAAALGFLTARWWSVAVALVLPIVELWVWSGLGSVDRDGFENWGLVALPFWCVGAAAVAAVAVALGRRRKRARQRPAP